MLELVAVAVAVVAWLLYARRRDQLRLLDPESELDSSRASTEAVGVDSEAVQAVKAERRAFGLSQSSSRILDSPSQAVQDRKTEFEAAAAHDDAPTQVQRLLTEEEMSPWDAVEKSAARLARKQRHQEREAERQSRRERKSARSHRHRHSEQKKADFLHNHKPDDATVAPEATDGTDATATATSAVRRSARRSGKLHADPSRTATTRRSHRHSKSARHHHHHHRHHDSVATSDYTAPQTHTDNPVSADI